MSLLGQQLNDNHLLSIDVIGDINFFYRVVFFVIYGDQNACTTLQKSLAHCVTLQMHRSLTMRRTKVLSGCSTALVSSSEHSPPQKILPASLAFCELGQRRALIRVLNKSVSANINTNVLGKRLSGENPVKDFLLNCIFLNA